MEKGIFKYFDCSTGHVTKKDMDLMEENSDNWPVCGISSAEYTWQLCPCEDDNIIYRMDTFRAMGFSEEFIKIILLASDKDCTYVRFDSCGTIHEKLKQFDW